MIKKNDIENTKVNIIWILKNSRSHLPGLIVIILMGAFGALSGVATAITSKYMVDSAVKGNLHQAGMGALLFAVLMFSGLGLNVWRSLLTVNISESMSNTMRQKIFAGLTETEWMPLAAYHSGDILTRLTSDVSSVVDFMLSTVPGIISLVVQLVAAFATLLHYEPRLAYLAFLLGPTTVLFSRIWGRKLKTLNIKMKESESDYRSYLQESLQNLLIIKSFGLEQYSRDMLQGLHEKRLASVIKLNRTTLTASTVMGGGFLSGYILAFVWGIYRLAHQAISFGTLTAFLQLVSQVQGPFFGLARSIPQTITAAASAGRLMVLEEMQRENKGEKLPAPRGVGMAFHQINFAYEEGQPILNDVSADIKPGEMVALVGPSGEGKTTMIRLLLALLRPDEGEVCFTDELGHRFAASAATRDWLTYVPQGNTLFSGTIADNLRYGDPGATEEDMEKAVRAACAWGFIKKLPQGLDTVIGEDGLGLSEGQAQRIAIARSLLKKAPVLIMDEATSALDMQSELHVLSAIKELGKDRTCLIITHRPSVSKICSRVLRLQDGGIVEEAV
ncbi:MAG TPA: ABC transporter ATP-binding protein [Syntrophomonadaceae bacterium]|nr:ABC transporter ATP-binding protein [Syntrophomonadaceae bacterium]